MTHQMQVDGHRIDVHFPPRRSNHSTGLAPFEPWQVYDASDYADQVPPEWLELGSPMRGVFFMGVPPVEKGDRELWFNFQPLNNAPHHYAILISVQGLNAVTGLPTEPGMAMGEYEAPDTTSLEQYHENCPAHGTPLGAQRMCEQCGFRWPPQNYVTNAAGSSSIAEFWRDGWRKGDGKIYQFAIRPTEAGVGVAQQILKACRTLAIDIVVFRSVEPKPVYKRPEYMTRGSGGLEWHSLLGIPCDRGGLDSFAGDDDDLVLESCVGFDGDDNSGPEMLGLTSDEEPVYRGAPVIQRMAAAPKMEVAAGREVVQEIHSDPHDLDFWEDEPCAMFTLIPTGQDWVHQVTANGPTTKTAKGGAFGGIQTV